MVVYCFLPSRKDFYLLEKILLFTVTAIVDKQIIKLQKLNVPLRTILTGYSKVESVFHGFFC